VLATKEATASTQEIAKAKAEERVLAEAKAGFMVVGEIRGFRSIVPTAVKKVFCEPKVSKVEPSNTQ